MSATITNITRTHSAKAFVDSLPAGNNYFFAGNITPWADEESPEIATGLYNETNTLKSSIIFIKKIIDNAGNMLALKRFDWINGTTYTPWDNSIDLYYPSNWLGINQPFYVLVLHNSNYNVYMCIDNNNGNPSFSMPTGQSTNVFSTADGYLWKFVYDIKPEYVSYISNLFFPCPHLDSQKTSKHVAVEQTVAKGTINRIKVITPGSGYNITSVLTISGDGVGAAATFAFDDIGAIIGITITNPGSGYSYASVSLSSPGNGVELTPVISPFEGHGYDYASQLCAAHAALKATFIHDEDGLFLTQNSYRRVGLIKNVKNTSNELLTGNKYNYIHEIQVNNISGLFPFSQKIIGTMSGASAVIYNIDPPEAPAASFFITDKKRNFLVGEGIYLESDPSKIAIVTAVINNPIQILSGELVYINNMQYVTRKAGQTETFLLTIEY